MSAPSRITKAGRLADFLPFAGLVDDGIMITKDAVLMRTFYLVPQDFAFEDDATIFSAIRALNGALRLISMDSWAIYIDAHRSRVHTIPLNCAPNAPETSAIFEKSRKSLTPIYQTKVFLSICKTIETSGDALNRLLFSEKRTETSDVSKDLAKFKLVTQDVFNMLQSCFKSVYKLSNSELLTYLHSTFSDTPHAIGTPEIPFYLDEYLADGLLYPDTVTKYNDDYIVTASVHRFPQETTAGFASRILSLPLDFRFVTRFVFQGNESAKKTMKTYRASHFKKRKGAGAMLQETVIKQETKLEDTEALALTADSSAAMASLFSGVSYGYATTTIVVRDKNFERASTRLETIQARINDELFVTKRDTLKTPLAFLGSIPGNLDFNPDKALISTLNIAHFFPTSVPWSGTYTNEHIQKLEREMFGLSVDYPLALTKSTIGHSLFNLNLNVGDVEHTLVIGPTGAGKSIFLNAVAVYTRKYPNSRVFFFDKDKSSQHPCNNSGGVFIELSDEPNSLKLNPFSSLTPEDKAEQTFVTQLVCDYLRDKNVPLSPTDEGRIYDAVVDVSSLPPEHRCWQTFRDSVQDYEIRSALDTFVSGEFSPFFTNGPDTITDNPWVTFEMGKIMQKPGPLINLILAYVFHKIEPFFGNGITRLILDEAWLFLANGTFAKRIEDWLRTLRKKHVGVMLATQNADDAFKSSIFATILNACPTKILLPNARARQPDNIGLYKALGLLDGDIYALEEAEPKRHYMYVSPLGKQTFDFRFTSEQIHILTRPYTPRRKKPHEPAEAAV